MRFDPDFKKMFYEGFVLVSVNVLYYLPDHGNLVQEFLWQTLDVKPKYPRVQKFLAYWEREIDARIKQVMLADSPPLRPFDYFSPQFIQVDPD